jgi:hypothetical protein
MHGTRWGAPAALAALALVALAIAPGALAKTFTPTKRGDPPPNGCKKRDCSLREAVISANARAGAGVIVLRGARPDSGACERR